jgi:hypothetical protein
MTLQMRANRRRAMRGAMRFPAILTGANMIRVAIGAA